MAEVADRIIGILMKNMQNPPERITAETLIHDLEIESFDLAVIVFDIEDTFGVEIPYNAKDEVEGSATVGTFASKTEKLIVSSRMAA